MIIQEQIEIKPQKHARVVQLGHYNPSEVLIALQCRFCDILLTGRDQFLGHMFHNHELEYEKLLDSWNQIVSVIGKMNHQAQTQSDTGEKPSLMRSAP